MTRPVIFYDLETTGKDKDTNNIRIVQISCYKYDNTTDWNLIDTFKCKCNNGDVHIEPGAIEVHGITEESVKDCPTFQEIAPKVFEFFDGCDIGGYNNSFFDNSVLYMSFLRTGLKWDYRKLKVYDVLLLYRKHHSNKLCDVYKRLTGHDLENAHDADSDIIGTVEVYKCLQNQGIEFEDDDLNFYKDNIDLIGDFKVRINSKGEKEPYYNFGAHKGESVESVGIGYLEWMTKQANKFPLDTVHVASKLKDWLEKKYTSQSENIQTQMYNKIKDC